MIKILLSGILLLAGFYNAEAQYYYKDLVSNTQVLADMKAYKENKIKKIVLKSFEQWLRKRRFFLRKKIKQRLHKIRIIY